LAEGTIGLLLPAEDQPGEGISVAISTWSAPSSDGPPIARGVAPTAAQALRDEALADDVADRLSHDLRTRHVALDVAVSGRVAHVAGTVPSEEDRERVRTAVRSVNGILAAWDLIAVDGDGALAVADIGCGTTKQVPWAIGVDAVAQPGVDVVADVDDGLPFATASLDHVFAVHVLEHVADMVAVMAELHRVLRPSGLLHVLCPHWRHVNTPADPTHVRGIDVLTFRWFCQPARGDVPPWRPRSVTADTDTVYADLQPLDAGGAQRRDLARWFA
jgi:SAM-dependent methyltransferase